MVYLSSCAIWVNAICEFQGVSKPIPISGVRVASFSKDRSEEINTSSWYLILHLSGKELKCVPAWEWNQYLNLYWNLILHFSVELKCVFTCTYMVRLLGYLSWYLPANHSNKFLFFLFFLQKGINLLPLLGAYRCSNDNICHGFFFLTCLLEFVLPYWALEWHYCPFYKNFCKKALAIDMSYKFYIYCFMHSIIHSSRWTSVCPSSL